MPGGKSKMCDKWMSSDIQEYSDDELTDAEAMHDAHQRSSPPIDANMTYDGMSCDEFVARHGLDMVTFAKAKM